MFVCYGGVTLFLNPFFMGQFYPSFNRVFLIGNQVAEATKRSSAHGAVVSFPLATNRNWKTKDGKEQSRTDYHRVTFFGVFADKIYPHLAKGRRFFIEGEIRYNSYEKDGQKKYSTEVNGDILYFLDEKDPRGENQHEEAEVETEEAASKTA